jgi:hypothetical protein
MSYEQLFEIIKEKFEAMEKDVAKGNKSSLRRARTMSSEIAKLFKEFRKITIEKEKQNENA